MAEYRLGDLSRSREGSRYRFCLDKVLGVDICDEIVSVISIGLGKVAGLALVSVGCWRPIGVTGIVLIIGSGEVVSVVLVSVGCWISIRVTVSSR